MSYDRLMELASGDIPRFAFGFANPNHAAAMICAVAPFLWGWRRVGEKVKGEGVGVRVGISFVLSVALVVALAMTFSRTGFVVLALEAAMWWGWERRWGKKMEVDDGWFASCCCRGDGAERIPHSKLNDSIIRLFRLFDYFHARILGCLIIVILLLVWMWPRLALDGAILNRPKIWFTGLQLFAANPNGVGLGNSGAVASAFALEDIPEVRTMISAHITLLAEFGWIVGWVWFAFIGLALCGVRESPLTGIAFAGLALSGCSSTIFDWSVLFDIANQGGLGMMNWTLSWTMIAAFVVFGAQLIWGRMRRPGSARITVAVIAIAGIAVLGLRLVPTGKAPQVRDGCVICGEAPRTLTLYDASWKLKTVAQRMKGGAVLPVRGVAKFPRELDWRGIDKVVLFGDCREWKHLVNGLPVECVEE